MISFEKKILAKRIRDRLSSNNMTQRDLADAMKVSPQTINAWVCEDSSSGVPNLNTLFTLAKKLGCTVSFLIGEIDTLKPEVSAIQQRIALSEVTIEKLLHYTASKEKLHLALFDAFISEDKLLVEGLENYIELLCDEKRLQNSPYRTIVEKAFKQLNSDDARSDLMKYSLDWQSFGQFPYEYGDGFTVKDEQFQVLLYWEFLKEFGGDKEAANKHAIKSVEFLPYLESLKYKDVKKYEIGAKYASIVEALALEYVKEEK